MTEIPAIVAIVLGVFLSPALPDGMIEIGKTRCEDAQVLLQKHHLRLVDTEYLQLFDFNSPSQITKPGLEVMAIHTHFYEQGTGGTGFADITKTPYFKKKPWPWAGFILCGFSRGTVF